MFELPARYQLDNSVLESPPPIVEDSPQEPIMLELNGVEDDAVVPVLKRPKYENENSYQAEQPEREVLKEYAFEDFFSSLVSFYTPDNPLEYGNSTVEIEPTKDLYWCSGYLDTDTCTESFGVPPDSLELLALCS